MHLRDTERATTLLERSLEDFRALDDTVGVASCLTTQALLALNSGQLEQGVALGRAAYAANVQLGNRRSAAVALHNMACCLAHLGRRTEARTGLEDSLREFRELGDIENVVDGLVELAELAIKCGARTTRPVRSSSFERA